MTVRCHYPTEQGGILELQRRVAELYADIVVQQILGLSIPKEQKLKLLDAVKDDIKDSLLHVGAAG